MGAAHGYHAVVRKKVGSPHPPRGSWGLNSGLQASLLSHLAGPTVPFILFPGLVHGHLVWFFTHLSASEMEKPP